MNNCPPFFGNSVRSIRYETMSYCSCAICRKVKLGQCSYWQWHVCLLQPNWRRLKSQSRWIYRLTIITILDRSKTISTVFLIIEFIQSQVGGSKFVFEARTIERMELLVLTTLGWRMQAVTPFSFIDHYLSKIHHDDKTSITRSIRLLLNIIQGHFLFPKHKQYVCVEVSKWF